MAELTAGEAQRPLPQEIPAATQLMAVAWLRWRIFVNNTFRRRPATARQAIGLVFTILLRLIVWPFLVLMVVGPVAGSGYWAWELMARGQPQRLPTLLAVIAVGWQFVAVNGLSVAATVSSFDPASLIRYPLRFGRYFVLRTLIGLLTPSTIVGCLSSLAAAVGIGIADRALAAPALLVLAVYAMMNVFLTRMIGAWMERWLAIRRFREIFSVLMALFAVSLQLLNFQRYPTHAHGVPNSWVFNLLHGSGAYLRWLPPGFAARAILRSSDPLPALAQFTYLLAVTLLFAWIFAVRLHSQFLGEYLSENAPRRTSARSAANSKAMARQAAGRMEQAALPNSDGAFPPVVAACLRKEWLTFRGNSSQMIGLVTPLIFVVILNRGQLAAHPEIFLPGAIAYVMLGALAGLYNIFGADGLGVQVYLLAPVRMRDVIVAKNIAGLVLVVTEAALAWALVSFLKPSPIPLATQVSTVLWAVFVIAANVSLGTLRSIQAPRRYVPGQTRRQRGTPTNRTSGLLILVVLFGSLIVQFPVVALSHILHLPWLAAWIFGPLAAVAIATYWFLLQRAEQLVLSRRDIFAEELCKT
jgi:ABC-2 type transport system permease protein